MEYINAYIGIIVQRIPIILIYIAGIGIAIARKEKHPRISLLAGIYFGGSLILTLFGISWSLFPLYARDNFGLSMMQVGVTMSVIGIITTLIDAALGIVLLYAVFSERDIGLDTIVEQKTI